MSGSPNCWLAKRLICCTRSNCWRKRGFRSVSCNNSLIGLASGVILGADDAMITSFYAALSALRPQLRNPLIALVVSDEAATYRPEMEWLAHQLQLLGKSQPLTLQATWNKSATSPLGGIIQKPYVMGVTARGSFKRSAFGMTYAVANGWVGDEVPLIIEFEAVRK